MTNVGPAAAYLHQQQPGHGYAGGPIPSSYPPPFPTQPYTQPQLFHPQQQLPQHSAPPQQIYQQFQQQHAAYGTPQQPLSNVPVTFSTAAAPQSIYTSAPYSRPVSATSTPLPVSQSGPAYQPGSGPQQAQSMAAPATPFHPNAMMQHRQTMPNGALAQQAQLQNAMQGQNLGLQPVTPVSPQSADRERARVSVLLDINAHLLQEVVSLQLQGKAGATSTQTQQSPIKDSATSPTSATDPTNPLNQSPIDPSKASGGKPPSPEYVECMRRLQANLSYLAAIADAKKKASGTLPSGPAIMVPPAHLADVTELYKKLNALFPHASQSAVNKAMAIASAQTSKSQAPIQAHG